MAKSFTDKVLGENTYFYFESKLLIMQKTIERNGVKITMDLDADDSVNLNQSMLVEFAGIQRPMFPTTGEGREYGSIDDQFKLVELDMEFDRQYTIALARKGN